jgi:hypothetical protein
LHNVSKVIDENGKPLVVYHGTSHEFKSFDKNKIGSNFLADKSGFFFTNNTEYEEVPYYADGRTRVYDNSRSAGAYAKASASIKRGRSGKIINNNDNIYNDAQIYPTYVNLKNPYIIEEYSDDSGIIGLYEKGLTNVKSGNKIIEEAKKQGYDGVIIRDLKNKLKNGQYETIVVAFEPTQIKSINNRGTFDENNPDIRYRIDQPHAETKETTPADRVISKTEKADIKLFNHKAGIETLAKRAKEAGLKAGAQIGIKSRNIAGLAGRVASTLNSNTFLIDKDGIIKITGEGLKTIIEDARKTLGEKDALKLQTDLNDYMIAKRYLDDLAT